MQNFRCFIDVYDTISESLFREMNLFSQKRGEDILRHLSDEEWAYISGEMEKAAAAGKTLPLTRDALGLTGAAATPVTKMLQPQFTKMMTSKAPTMQAWERNGLEADPQTVHADMKKRGEQILPSPAYTKSYGIKRLRELRDKLMLDPNAAIGEREQQIIGVWKQLSGGDIIGQSDHGELRLGPEHVFDYLEKRGMRDLAITDDEAELEFIDDVQEDMVAKHLPSTERAGSKSAMRKLVARWLGRVDPEAKKGEKGVTSTRPENVKGLQQWLDKGGDPADLPNAYTGFRQNIPAYGYKADPDVIAQYRGNRDLWIDQIVKPACLAASKRLRKIASEVTSAGGNVTTLALGSYINPEAEPPGSDGAFCGMGSDAASQEMLRRANEFLEDGDGSFDGVVRDIIKGMEDSTNWVDPETGETWMEREKFRHNRASWLALRAFDKIYKKMMRRKAAETGREGDPTGKKQTKAEKEKLRKAQQAVRKALESEEAAGIVARIKELTAEIDASEEGEFESEMEREERQAVEEERTRLLRQLSDMMTKGGKEGEAAKQALARIA